MIYLDYIQLLARMLRNHYNGIKDQFQIVGHLVRDLQFLTKSYKNGEGISIVALSQLNRASYSAIKERLKNPRINEVDKYKNIYDLTSISESSEIVNAADAVITIYRDHNLQKEKKAVIQLIKNRFGEPMEEGFSVLAMPEISYIGNYIKESEYTLEDGYIHNLISGKLI
jgi:replicative DNA helicase